MYRSAKIEFGKKVLNSANAYSSVLVCGCEKMTANQLTNFRLSVRRAGGKIQMGGNLIIGRALENSKFKVVSDYLRGNNLMVFFDHNTPGQVIKAVQTAIKENKDEENNEKIAIKFCALNGESCNANMLTMLSKYESPLHVVAALLHAVVSPFQALAIFSKQYYELEGKEG